jgi:hypothetical protein
MAGDSDEVMLAHALGVAAAMMTPVAGEEPGEKRHLEPAVRDGLTAQFGADRVRIGYRVPGGLPDWNPQPGPVDAVLFDARGGIRVGLELKVYKLDETLWDVFKMASLARLAGVEAAYVAVVATGSKWASNSDCAALFQGEVFQETEWHSGYFFEQWRAAWANLLRGGRGRPTRVPERLMLTLVDELPLSAWPGWTLRLLRVENPPTPTWLLLDEWPTGREPPYESPYPRQISDGDLSADDLPAPDAEEDALHLFALTTNGYARAGSMPALAALARKTREAWRQTGVPPGGRRELRASLFYEQRNAHFSGYEFDAETMRYARAIVERLRELLFAGA